MAASRYFQNFNCHTRIDRVGAKILHNIPQVAHSTRGSPRAGHPTTELVELDLFMSKLSKGGKNVIRVVLACYSAI